MAPKPITVELDNSSQQATNSETVSTTSGRSTNSSRPGRRTRRSKTSKQAKKEKLPFIYDSHLTRINAKPIYGVAFYQTPLQCDQKPQYIFATAGGTCCMVFECLQPTGMRLLLTFMDPHKKENFYTCAWMYGAPILAVAGQHGIIRLLSVRKAKLVANLTGHAGPINDLKFHPTREYLLMSASKDYSVRLWNIKTKVMVAIFSGVDGHRDEIVSADFHLSGNYILTCGIDHAIKIWSLEEAAVREAISESYNYQPQKAERNFPTVRQHFPLYTRSDVHDNYVDCVQWFQDFILSKACENVIVCWKPGDLNTPLSALATDKPKGKTILKLFEYKNCDVWFIRFAFHPQQYILALGNQVGDVNIWEFDPVDPYKTHLSVLKHAQSTTTVRQVAMSRDANILVYVCEDGSVWRWNRTDPIKQGR